MQTGEGCVHQRVIAVPSSYYELYCISDIRITRALCGLMQHVPGAT